MIKVPVHNSYNAIYLLKKGSGNYPVKFQVNWAEIFKKYQVYINKNKKG